jgi:hypothetical protein
MELRGMTGWRLWAWTGGTWGGILIITMVLVAVSSKTWDLKIPYAGGCNTATCKLFPGGVADIADNRGDQCEAVNRKSIVLEFENTWSNFAYLFAGLLILYRSRSLLAINVGANLCTLFLFSGFYHASLQPNLQTMDVAWVYCEMLSLIFDGVDCVVQRFGYPMRQWLKFTLFIVTYVLGLIMAVLRTKISVFDSTNAFVQMAMVLFGLAAAGGSRLESSYDSSTADGPSLAAFTRSSDFMLALSILLGVFATSAFTFRLLDGKGDGGAPKAFCSPNSVVQAHALWHILSAAAILLTYEIYARISGRNETIFGQV